MTKPKSPRCGTLHCRRDATHRLTYSFPEARGNQVTDDVCEPCGKSYLSRPSLMASLAPLPAPPVPGDYERAGLVIDWIDNLPSTACANPRRRVHFTDGTDALTMSDQPAATGIGNHGNLKVPLTVTFSRAGRIRRITRENNSKTPGRESRP